MDINELTEQLKRTMKSNKPIYLHVANVIEDAILNKDFMVGQFLPAERIWAKELGIARITISQAYQILEKRGLVSRQQGSGTQVLGQIIHSLNQPFDLYAQLERSANVISERLLIKKVVKADRQLSKLFDLDEGIELSFFKRIYMVNDIPIILENVFIPTHLLPNPYAYGSASDFGQCLRSISIIFDC